MRHPYQYDTRVSKNCNDPYLGRRPGMSDRRQCQARQTAGETTGNSDEAHLRGGHRRHQG
ncbi:hypothetical protein MPLB_390021 [Mesorhizobium sp. ORS 3324]|nr:hypothetical protein MPLB_390021 [Mesorhizobium sp. ORS 3324]